MCIHQSCLSLFLAIAVSFIGVPERSWALGFQPVSPDELKMTSEPKAPGAAAIILFRELDRDDRGLATQTVHEEVYFRIKILTEEGRKYADIEIPYWKNAISIKQLHARAIKPDASIVEFQGKVFDKTIVKARGVKYLAKTFTLSDVAVGGIIEYFYTVEFKQFVFHSQWIVSNELFTKSAKFSLNPYRSLELRWTWHGLAPEGNPVITPDRMISLEVSDIPAFQTEDFMPPENEAMSAVDFIYNADAFTSDPDKYWKQFGEECNNGLESFIGKPKAMEQAVAEIVSPNDSTELKLEKIYARVQQLRNMSFEAEKTAQQQKREKEKWPKDAEEVWKWQRGNGTQLTWLFVALARAAGIEVYGVWIAERSSLLFSPRTMDSHWLTTNVALVKLNGKDVYFDPGYAFVPFGMLPLRATGVSGYKLDKTGGGWIKTTLPDSAQSRIERKAELRVTDTDDLEGKLTVTFIGLESSGRRVEERFADEAARKKFIEDEVKEWIPAASEVELANQPDWKSSSPSLVAEFTLKVPGWVSAAGRLAVLPVGLFGAPEKHMFDHANRIHPIYFEFPFERVDDVSIRLPRGWQIVSVPEPKQQDLRIIAYTSQAVNNNSTLHLHRTLKVDSMLIGVTDYPALRNFFQGIRAADEQQVMLQPSNASASN